MDTLNKFRDKKTGATYGFEDSVARQSIEELRSQIDGGLAVTGAKVGQTVKISAVDENGIPTAWEAVEFPGEEEYELIQTVTVEEEGIMTVAAKNFPDGKPLSLNKVFATLKFPLLESDIATGSLEFNIGTEGSRVYSSYSSSLELKPNSLGRYFQMTVWAEINGGVLVGEGNMSITVQLESSRKVVGPVAAYMGNKTINSVSAYVGNGIPVGSVFELYGVRA